VTKRFDAIQHHLTTMQQQQQQQCRYQWLCMVCFISAAGQNTIERRSHTISIANNH